MEFDVIVVGAGSAGAVVAERLSADPDRRVLLLEDGPDHTSAATPPAIAGPDFWQACAEPGRVYADLVATHAPGQQPTPYLRGRGAGGSSAVNAMLALRGLPADYDRWATDLGCAGWSWAEVEPWLRAAEDDREYGGDGVHGAGGPIPLQRLTESEWTAIDRALQSATADLGYGSCPDHQTPGAEGFGPAPLTVRDGVRVSTNDAFVEPARGRANLTVRGDVTVDRVEFDGGRATGVRTAAGEVIRAGLVVLSGGTIGSPAILLRSGVHDRPVGENLIEHPLLPLVLVLSDPEPGVRTVSTVVRYSSGHPDAGPVDMQILPLATFGTEPPLSGASVLGVAATQVFSRGRVRLAGDDPATPPQVDFGMLTDPRDRDRMRDGVRRLFDLAAHPAVASLAGVVLAGETPIADLEDPGALERWMDATVTNYVHSVGTCRMGAPDDPAAVVDPAFRVIGREGLAVVDASVMPDIPRANTHLTTVAMALRACEHFRRL